MRYIGLYRDNGKENGNYHIIVFCYIIVLWNTGYMGLYGDNGKYNGNYYNG